MDALGHLNPLTEQQWYFLATFNIFAEPVSLNLVGALSPLPPGQLVELLENCEESNILQKVDIAVYRIADELPKQVLNRISKINTKQRYTKILEYLKEDGSLKQLTSESLLRLLIHSGNLEQAGIMEAGYGQEAMEKADYISSLDYHGMALEHLLPSLPKHGEVYIASALDYSDLCLGRGRNFIKALDHLKKACTICRHLDDKRSEAFMHFHIGRLYFLLLLRWDAMEEMAIAAAIVGELDDDDIQERSAEFMALYCYMQGRLNDAIVYFERAYKDFESRHGNRIINPLTPIFYGICGVYLGQFHKSIGCLDSAWRYARRKSNPMLATTIKAVLGTALLLVNKKQDGAHYLNEAFNEALTQDSAIGRYFAVLGLVQMHFNEGQIDKAYELATAQAATRDKHYREHNPGIDLTTIRHFTATWMFELIYEFERLGYPPMPNSSFQRKIEEYLSDPSIHLQGVGLRYKAKQMLSGSGNTDDALKTLLKSEALLKQAGDPIQTAKTRIEVACFKLNQNNREEACSYARKARKGLSGFWEDYFPDGIRAILESDEEPDIPAKSSATHIERFFQITDNSRIPSSLNKGFDMLLSTMNRYFRAERGGLFWNDGNKSKTLMIKVSYNLNEDDIAASSFRSNMKYIQQAFKQNRPILFKSKRLVKISSDQKTKTLLCIPLSHDGNIRGVLYHDNSFLDDCFDFIDKELLSLLTKHINIQIDRLFKLKELIQEVRASTLQESVSFDQLGQHQIITGSTVMEKILKQSEKIAASDSSVLILGESGSGKELLARRIHNLSTRCQKPFVILDPTTIPENLMESELFGYEKGAFTGAERRRVGRVELAHQGTLFIDEIGEIPLAAQSKLLRLLQEKTFTRVGGNNLLSSDFRLIASTNRDLKAAVQAKSFREDLFYRINIIPISLPPLRERDGDIIILARYFIDFYKKKLNCPHIELTPEDEQKISGYYWPGNVRELVNVIERSMILSTDKKLELSLLPELPPSDLPLFEDHPTMEELQRRYIIRVLKMTNGKLSGPGGAAEILGMKRTTLYSRMKKFNINTINS